MNIHLEHSVLSTILMEGEEYLPIAIARGLTAECFDLETDCKIIYEVIESHYLSSNSAPDSIQVMDSLFESDKYSKVESTYMLLSTSDAPVARFQTHLDDLIAKTYKRLIREAYAPFKGLRKNANQQEFDKAVSLNRDTLIHAEQYNLKNLENTNEIIDELLEEADNSIEGITSDPAISMNHLDGFEKEFTPIERSEFVVVGARTSVGKTSFVSQIISNNLANQKKIAMFPLESCAKEVIRQVSAQVAGVNFRFLNKSGPNAQRLYKETVQRFREIKDEKIFFSQENKIHKMTSYLDNLLHKHGAFDCVIVDYIQLVQGGNQKDSRAVRIGEYTSTMKQWCARYNCAVIGLAQVNRQSEADDRPPRLSDLRESGSIEQDANRVLFLHRPKKNSDGVEQEKHRIQELELIQAKQRFGPKAQMGLTFEAEKTRFTRRGYNLESEY